MKERKYLLSVVNRSKSLGLSRITEGNNVKKRCQYKIFSVFVPMFLKVNKCCLTWSRQVLVQNPDRGPPDPADLDLPVQWLGGSWQGLGQSQGHPPALLPGGPQVSNQPAVPVQVESGPPRVAPLAKHCFKALLQLLYPRSATVLCPLPASDDHADQSDVSWDSHWWPGRPSSSELHHNLAVWSRDWGTKWTHHVPCQYTHHSALPKSQEKAKGHNSCKSKEEEKETEKKFCRLHWSLWG